MTSFTIDDVRETMPREVTEFLARIEQSAHAFLNAPCTSEHKLGALLRSIRHDGHAIYGSSALVSARALASCADLVERLAERAQIELLEAEQRIARARRVVELLPAGTTQMQGALALELEHQGDEAEWNVAEWLGKAETTLDELCREPAPAKVPSLHPMPDADSEQGAELAQMAPAPALAPEAFPEPSNIEYLDDEIVVETLQPDAEHAASAGKLPPLEFSFEDFEPAADPPAAVESAPEPVAAPLELLAMAAEEGFSFPEDLSSENAGADLKAELLGVFQDEAREAVVALQGYINALGSEPSVAESAGPLERIYHTLKGAAATVGLTEVSRHAEDLQHRAEALLVRSEPLEEPMLSELVDDTNRLFAMAGLDTVHVGMPVAPPASVALRAPPPPDELRKEFLREAREIHGQAAALVAELSAPSGGKFAQSILATLGPLFHRLKGSARLVSETSVAESAAQLEEACEAASAPTTATLSLGLARIAAKLGLMSAPRPVEPVEDPAILAATQASFELEARRLLEDALRLTRHLGGAGSRDSGVEQAQRELGRLFHHLGGSARIVGNTAVADEARALEGLIKDDEHITQAALSAVGERLGTLRARFGLDSQASQAAAPKRAAAVREKIDFHVVAELWPTFTLECSELLESIEKNCFLLEESNAPKEQLKTLLRAVHTLKGVVNTIGLVPTGRILHRVEDLLEMLQEAPILPPTRHIASLLIEVEAEVRRNLKEAPSGSVETRPERLEQRIAALWSGRRDSRDVTQQNDSRQKQLSDGLPSAHHSSEISLAHGADGRVIRVSTERLDVLMNLAGELVVSRSRLNSRVERLRSLQGDLVRGSRRLVDTVETFRDDHEFANLDGRKPLFPLLPGSKPSPHRDDVGGAPLQVWGGFSELELDRYEGIHVLTRSLSELTSDFSELHTQLSRGLLALTDDADLVGSIVSGIQTEITRARMIPLDLLFMRLRLPLRDAALRERKEVRVVVRGQDVPVDKTIADTLFQPMLHLVRNAVVHGIESSEQRAASGKSNAGSIELSARQDAGQIVIEVRDDGGGLDFAALQARGVQMGLLGPETPLDDPRVAELVFAQGLSTQRAVNDLAGRGVGCEVVKRAVERLNGSIRVESERGKGTAFVIRLPLTLAITRALVVKKGTHSYAVPLHFAERIIDAHEQEVIRAGELRRIKLDDALLPVRTLDDFFGVASGETTEGPVLILRVGDARVALQVDSIVAHEEIVAKSLGSLLTGHPNFAGITIRGTGDLVLILDVPSLVEAKGTSAGQRQRALGAPSASELADAPPALPAPVRKARGKLRVLFADDSVSVRKVAEMQLRELGVDVITAVDGADAMVKLREHKVDILFTDLEMPRMHGYELIRELRFLPAYKDLPIVVVTSRSSQKHQDQARQLGASEYVTKPFTPQVLAAALKKWTRREDSTQGPSEGVEESVG